MTGLPEPYAHYRWLWRGAGAFCVSVAGGTGVTGGADASAGGCGVSSCVGDAAASAGCWGGIAAGCDGTGASGCVMACPVVLFQFRCGHVRHDGVRILPLCPHLLQRISLRGIFHRDLQVIVDDDFHCPFFELIAAGELNHPP